MPIQLTPQPEDFIWASGIEDTFVPQTRPGHRALDEYQLIGHYQHWREDLALCREIGIKALRWGVPWYRVEPFPGEFDWRWTDQVIPYLVEELGITPIIDLMHYGCPYWLYQEFANPDYPQRVADYAAAFAARYAHLVRWYTPLNEPHINAVWCGYRALWPPYLRGDKGYLRIMLQLVKGILRTVAALKSVDPSAVMVHVEATGINRAGHPDLEAHAIREQTRGFLSYDLLTGKFTADHLLYNWLLSNGISPAALDNITRSAISIEVMGLNFYPQWSTRIIQHDRQGRPVYRVADKAGTGFTSLVESYHQRYGVPLFITETSARGSAKVRSQWLRDSLAAVKDMRSRSIPIYGYTWFPMFTMVNWQYRTGRAPLRKYLLDLGFYSLSQAEDAPRWKATSLINQWQHHITDPTESIGTLSL